MALEPSRSQQPKRLSETYTVRNAWLKVSDIFKDRLLVNYPWAMRAGLTRHVCPVQAKLASSQVNIIRKLSILVNTRKSCRPEVKNIV